MSGTLKKKLKFGFNEGWNKGNLAAMYELCVPHFVHYRPPLPPLQGLQAEKDDIAATFRAFSDIQFEIHEMVEEGDTVVMRWTWQGTQITEFHGAVKPSKNPKVSMDGCSILHLHEGKIVDEWEFADYSGISYHQ